MCAWNIDGPYCECAGVCSAIMNCIMWQEIDGRYKQNFSKLNVENRSKLSIFLKVLGFLKIQNGSISNKLKSILFLNVFEFL